MKLQWDSFIIVSSCFDSFWVFRMTLFFWIRFHFTVGNHLDGRLCMIRVMSSGENPFAAWFRLLIMTTTITALPCTHIPHNPAKCRSFTCYIHSWTTTLPSKPFHSKWLSGLPVNKIHQFITISSRSFFVHSFTIHACLSSPFPFILTIKTSTSSPQNPSDEDQKVEMHRGLLRI